MYWIELLKGLGELIAAVAALIAAVQSCRARKDVAAIRNIIQKTNVTQQQVVAPTVNLNVNVSQTAGEGREGAPITFSPEPAPKPIAEAGPESPRE